MLPAEVETVANAVVSDIEAAVVRARSWVEHLGAGNIEARSVAALGKELCDAIVAVDRKVEDLLQILENMRAPMSENMPTPAEKENNPPPIAAAAVPPVSSAG